MATTVTPSPEVPAAMGPIARLTGVLFSPKKTFADIVRKPSWVVPVVLLTLFSIAVSVAINQRTNWREYISQQMEKSPQAAQLPPDQKAQRVEAGAKFVPIVTYVFGTLAPVFFVFVVALVMMGAYNLFAGAGARFSASLGIVAHASIPSLVSSVIFLLVLYLKAPGTIDLENPVATNVGAFLPEGSAAWLVSLFKSIDIFSIWILMLIAIGFAFVNPKKLKGSKPYIIACSVWGIFVVLRVGWALIFS
jgi:hypothetical protein